MVTLNELANKLQAYIIEQQVDPHNFRQLSVHRYNNLKLKIAQLNYPNVIVCIGISEATYNLDDGCKVDGGLGQDEKYVRKWLGRNTIRKELKELYYQLTDLISLEEEVLMEEEEYEGTADEAKEVDFKIRKRKSLLPEDSPLQEFEYDPSEEAEVKKEYEQSFHNPSIPALQRFEDSPELEKYKGPGILKTLQEAVAMFNLNDFINGKYKQSINTIDNEKESND